MPLDTSTYNLALLRVDGRRWNEIRHLHAQMRTQASADGSAYLEIGNTKVMCVVTGPSEDPKKRAAAAQQNAGITMTAGGGADIAVSVSLAGFSGVDRRRRGRNDKRVQELQTTVGRAVAATVQGHLFARSTIWVSLHVLAQDGSVLAALINAATLALVDAGVPMTDYLVATTAGSTSSYAADDDGADPIVDLNQQEENELPFLTMATLGATDRVAVLVCESRVQISRLEGMMASAADACRGMRDFLDRIVREKGTKMVAEGTVTKGIKVEDMEID